MLGTFGLFCSAAAPCLTLFVHQPRPSQYPSVTTGLQGLATALSDAVTHSKRVTRCLVKNVQGSEVLGKTFSSPLAFQMDKAASCSAEQSMLSGVRCHSPNDYSETQRNGGVRCCWALDSDLGAFKT